MEKTFYTKLKEQSNLKESRLCIGLDIDHTLLPDNFNKTTDGTFDFINSVTNKFSGSIKYIKKLIQSKIYGNLLEIESSLVFIAIVPALETASAPLDEK